MTTTSKAAPESGYKHPRAARGLALYRERGGEIVEVAPGVFRVPSTTGRGYYRADLEAKTCECKDHEQRGTFCLHLYAAAITAAKKNASCRRQRTATERPSRRHGERRGGTQDNTRGAGDIGGPESRGSIDPVWIRANPVIKMGG